MREARSHRGAARPTLLGWVLLAVEVLVALVACFLVLVRRFSIPHCGEDCHFEMLWWAGTGFVIACALTLAISIWMFFHLSRRDRTNWWAPAAGIVLILVAALIANHLSDVALLFVG